MKKISIVLSGSTKNEYSKDAGGIQLAEVSFCNALAFSKKDCQVEVFAGGSVDGTEVNEFGVNVNKIQYQNAGLGGIHNTWDFSQKVRQKLTSRILNGNNTIHFTSLGPALTFMTDDLLFYKKNNKVNAKIVYTFHNHCYALVNKPYNLFKDYKNEWKFLHIKEKTVAQEADHVIVTSKRLVNPLSNILNRKVNFIPNTIGPLEEYNLTKTYTSKSQPILLSLCRFAEEKNLFRSAQAFKKLLSVYPHALWLIGGDGELRQNFIDKCKHLGLNIKPRNPKSSLNNTIRNKGSAQVILLGQVAGQDKSWLFNLADVFFLPSLMEVSPLVGLESLAYGKIIVASTIPGWMDFKDNGAKIFLANPRNINNITKNLIMATNLIINNKNLDYSNHNRRIYDTFYSPRVVIPQRLAVYNSPSKKY